MDCPESIISSMMRGMVMSKFERHSKNMRRLMDAWSTVDNKVNDAVLHNYQIEALINTWKQADRDRPTPDGKTEPMLIVAPTGSGKTGVIVFLPYVLSAKKALILTPSVVITEQIRDQLMGEPCFFEKINMFKPAKRDQFRSNIVEEPKVIKRPSDVDTQSNLVIVNAQKFGGNSGLSLVHKDKTIIENARKFFQRFDTLIVDEAHHYTAVTWKKIVEEFQRPVSGLEKRIVFLTATPYKYEKSGTHRIKELILGPGKEHRVVHSISREMLTGITIRPCVFHEPSHKGKSYMIFEDVENIFRDQMQNENRFVPQVMILIRLKDDAVDLANDLNLKFKKRYTQSTTFANLENYAVAVVSINKNRNQDLQKFNEGKFRVMITCGIGLEGYDNPNVVACVILRKIVTGRMLFDQFVGRCLRLNRQLPGRTQDKTVAVVLSYPEFRQRILWDELFDAPVITDEDVDDGDLKSQWVKASTRSRQPPRKNKISSENQKMVLKMYVDCKQHGSDGSTGLAEPVYMKHRYSKTKSGLSDFIGNTISYSNQATVSHLTFPFQSLPSRDTNLKIEGGSTRDNITGSEIHYTAPVSNLTAQEQTSLENSVFLGKLGQISVFKINLENTWNKVSDIFEDSFNQGSKSLKFDPNSKDTRSVVHYRNMTDNKSQDASLCDYPIKTVSKKRKSCVQNNFAYKRSNSDTRPRDATHSASEQMIPKTEPFLDDPIITDNKHQNETSLIRSTHQTLSEAPHLNLPEVAPDPGSENRDKNIFFKSRQTDKFVASDEHEIDGDSENGSVELGSEDPSSSVNKSDDVSDNSSAIVERGSEDSYLSEQESDETSDDGSVELGSEDSYISEQESEETSDDGSVELGSQDSSLSDHESDETSDDGSVELGSEDSYISEQESDETSDDGSVELGSQDSSLSDHESDDGSVELGSQDTSDEHESSDEEDDC